MFEISVDSRAVTEGLSRLLRNAHNRRPMLRAMATELHSLTEDNFAAEAWGGQAWPKSTRAQEEGGKTLQNSGQLAASIQSSADNDFARIGSNKPYAAIHQLGGKTPAHTILPKHKQALAFGGIVRKSVHHPGSQIPARPYLPVDGNGNLQSGAEERLLNIALLSLQQGL